VLVHVAGVGLAGAAAYLLALRWWFPRAAADLAAAVGRIVPSGFAAAPLRRLAGGVSRSA
jgi:hypothetical protein